MKLFRLLLIVPMLGLAACVTTSTLSGERQLNAQEVAKLFSNRTVESYNRRTRQTSFTYYRPDGRILQQRYWSKRSGHWRIEPDGRICLKFDRERCRHIVQRKGRYYKMVPKKGTAIRYREFVEGNIILARGKRWQSSTEFRP